jgi:ketosteroid isomerase-like protein
MKLFALVLLSFALVVGACAQDAAPTGDHATAPTHIVTRTRTVAVFDDLERKLMTAVQKKDKAALSDLTSEDFELRRSSAPAEPDPRDAWIANELPTYELVDFRVSQMAVHLYGEDTAVVSMNYWQSATVNGKDRSGDFFVVDVWTKHENGWKLSVRYVSSSPTKSASARTEDKKPTGKQ